MILNHLNNIEPEHIKFTMVEEKDNKLAALDLELNVKEKEKDRIQRLLQRNKHQHHHQEEIEPHRQHKERDHQRIFRQSKSTLRP